MVHNRMCTSGKSKKSSTKLSINGLTALLLSMCTLSVQADLVANGSFETTRSTGSDQFGNYNVAGWQITSNYTFLTFPGTADTNLGWGLALWDASNGGVNAGNFPVTSPDGGNFVVSDSDYQMGTIYQTVTGLVPGAFYQLSFYQAAGQQKDPRFTAATVDQWRVSFGGSLSTSAITLPNGETVSNVGIIDGAASQLSQLMNDPGMGFIPWMQQTMTFQATAAS